MKLRALSFSGGVVLAWADPIWLQYILPADSRKKQILRAALRCPLTQLVSRRFRGKLILDGRSFDLAELLEQVAEVLPDPIVSAIFVNSRRDPPRIYIWFSSGGHEFFVKVGTDRDGAAFQNEFEVSKDVTLPNGSRTLRHLALSKYDGLHILVSEGLEQSAHSRKKRLLAEDMLVFFSQQGLRSEGFFGGAVHGDLASNNVFLLDDEILVVDWEFGARSGPDYCDLIELAAAHVIADPTAERSFGSIRDVLQRTTGFDPPERALLESLMFLSSRGNSNAQQMLVSVTRPESAGP